MARERQLTFGHYGHMLNHRQAISPDGQWVVYDTRNADSHIARTDSIEMVKIESGEIVRLYQTPTHSLYGPGVGAVAFHPYEQRVVFIHGLKTCSSPNPYSAARRFGAVVDVGTGGSYVHAEARSVLRVKERRTRPFGALSGGTHAHSWSRDGWLSFTYNDAWHERCARTVSHVRDLRTVGFMVPGMPILLDGQDDGENFSGSFGAFLVASVRNSARRGSDEIEQAVEECWVGTNGYINQHGFRHPHAIAFQGAVRDDSGALVNEIFVCDLPNASTLRDRVAQSQEMRMSELLEPTVGCLQRRLTHTLHRKFPGIQGPRNWLVCSPEGSYVYAPMRDERGIVQVVRVSIGNGDIEQISDMEQSIEGQISVDRSGSFCSYICDQRICVVEIATGKPFWLTEKMERRLSGAVHFAGEHRVVFNRYVGTEPDGWNHVFVCDRD